MSQHPLSRQLKNPALLKTERGVLHEFPYNYFKTMKMKNRAAITKR